MMVGQAACRVTLSPRRAIRLKIGQMTSVITGRRFTTLSNHFLRIGVPLKDGSNLMPSLLLSGGHRHLISCFHRRVSTLGFGHSPSENTQVRAITLVASCQRRCQLAVLFPTFQMASTPPHFPGGTGRFQIKPSFESPQFSTAFQAGYGGNTTSGASRCAGANQVNDTQHHRRAVQ